MSRRKPRPERYHEPETVTAARGAANGVVWAAWPVISWVLPILLFLLVAGSGGWELVIVMLLSPVLLPLFALTNLLPRMIMRRGLGLRSSTSLVSLAMIVHWWSLVLFVISYRGEGDSGRIDSLLGDINFWVREPLEEGLAAAALSLIVLSYVTAIAGVVIAARETRTARASVLQHTDAFAFEPPVETAPDAAPRTWWHRGHVWVGVAAVLVPVLMWAAIAIGVSAGKALADRTAQELEEAWEATQTQAAPIRADISETDWYLEGGGAWIEPARIGAQETATVAFSWRYASSGSIEAMTERARTAVEGQGWILEPAEVDEAAAERQGAIPGSRVQFEATDAEGTRLTLIVETHEQRPDGEVTEEGDGSHPLLETRVVLRFERAPEPVGRDLWINWRERTPTDEYDLEIDPDSIYGPGSAESYGPDEWPSLALVESTLFR